MKGCVTLIVTFLKYYLADCGTHVHKLISKTDIGLPSINHTYKPFVFFRFLDDYFIHGQLSRYVEMKSCAQKQLSSVTKGLKVCPVGED